MKEKWTCFWCKKKVRRGYQLYKLIRHIEGCRKEVKECQQEDPDLNPKEMEVVMAEETTKVMADAVHP